MSNGRKTRTEHAGAKNGGGYWGRRAFAKEVSSSLRRRRSKAEVVYLSDLFVAEYALSRPVTVQDEVTVLRRPATIKGGGRP